MFLSMLEKSHSHWRKERMSESTNTIPARARAIEGLDIEALRGAIREEYALVAAEPAHGFHFHTGRPLARLVGYDDRWLDGIPEATVACFAGTGNPFSRGELREGERVVDIGCGGGIDSLIAARMVGPQGRVIGIDMTPDMIARARASAEEIGVEHVEFCEGYAESLPVEDGWADVVISNGVMNLFPDKFAGLQEMARILGDNGRLQIGDILVERPLSDGAKRNIDLWKG
jgi:SAM-dependent methyltransferase